MGSILGADFIVSVTVVCGEGGRWRGVVKRGMFVLGEKCMVYLPDSILPESEDLRFMERHGWRVKMCRFKGSPSEVLIMPIKGADYPIGTDCTHLCGVSKFFKPIPANLQGKSIDFFPSFIPKTDELNYQRHFDLVEQLDGHPYYITEKADGSSSTAYKRNGHFGVCSRNLELFKDYNNGYWQIAKKYELEQNLPDGIAIQWETCGPNIQSNPMGLKEIEGFAFSAYNIENHKYLEMSDFLDLGTELKFPTVEIIEKNASFDKNSVETLGEGVYKNGKQREGVVVRSQKNVGHSPISFKVMNLNYEA